jgi:xanthine dehydrogenase accessory factor
MAHIFADLVERGFGSEDLGRIETPVGIEIGAETPEEIAVSIVARMIAVRRGVSADRVRTMGAGLPGRFAAIQAPSVAQTDRRNSA